VVGCQAIQGDGIPACAVLGRNDAGFPAASRPEGAGCWDTTLKILTQGASRLLTHQRGACVQKHAPYNLQGMKNASEFQTPL